MAEVEGRGAAEGRQSGGRITGGGLHLFEIAGIKVTINYSWLVIFVLVTWGLAAGYFPHYFPDYSTRIYWLAGVIAAVLFFASILIHELSHSITAVRSGIKIPEITLFIFGGVAHLSEEPDDPKLELKIAIAGPITSFILAGIFWLITAAIRGAAPLIIAAVFEYLAWINVALAIFNLVPGYPLDGGRIFRALVWWKTGSVVRATKWASDIGKGFAWALMILGIVQIFSGVLVGGLWLIFIGMFLKGIAATGYQETLMRQSLEGVRVHEVMMTDAVSVEPNLSLEDLTKDYFLRYCFGGFPVVEQGRPMGLVSLALLKNVPLDERQTKTVADVMVAMGPDLTIEPQDTLVEALKKMTRSGQGRLLVMQGDQFMGMITKSGLLRFLEIKQVLEQ